MLYPAQKNCGTSLPQGTDNLVRRHLETGAARHSVMLGFKPRTQGQHRTQLTALLLNVPSVLDSTHSTTYHQAWSVLVMTALGEEAGGAEVHGHSQLHRELEASLGC